jgi:exopolysaccharide biosynthesis polyprenyl glycosylphosphotransferase
VLVALLSVVLGRALRFGAGGLPPQSIGSAGPIAFYVISTLVVLYIADAYNSTIDFRRPRELVRLATALSLAILLHVAAAAMVPEAGWDLRLSLLTATSLFVSLPLCRALLCRRGAVQRFRLKTIVVGTGRAGQLLAAAVQARSHHDRIYDVVGFVHPGQGNDTLRGGADLPRASDLPILGSTNQLESLVEAHGVELIVVATDAAPDPELTRQLLVCKVKGVGIEDMPTSYTRLTGKVPVRDLSGAWLLFGPAFAAGRAAAFAQRAVDIVVALVGAIVSAPVVAVAAALVRLESEGPAFYLQERLGRDERPFRIIKLRTMRRDAEAASGAVWSQGAGDPRVTRVGRFLRRSRIDELPQFYNVLRGDMSLVGPRPEREHFVTQLKERIPFYSLRFSVKPGVTGWAQVEYRYGASDEDAAEKLCYELYAIQEMSPMMYGLILLKTVQTVLLRPGS